MPTPEIRKLNRATVSYGRGSDARRTTARYGVFLSGKLLAEIYGGAYGYMERPNWEVVDVRSGCTRFYGKSFQECRSFAINKAFSRLQ